MPSSPAENTSETRREAALRFLVGRIDYERTQSMPCSEEFLKLDRMRELLRRLGNPQDAMPIIHVAGTKGKGSTSAMIAAILSAAGFRTGLFTSPHIERVEERIVLDAQRCSPDEFADLVERVRPHIEAMDRDEGAAEGCKALNPDPQSPIPNSTLLGLTYFEILTAMALDHFRHRHVDAAVLEVGLGGRLDSTNVCSSCVSIITSISFDHTKQLGETLAAIAAEKAGIIKPGVPVISGVDVEEPREVIRRIAQQNGCRLTELGGDFDFDYRPPRHLEQAASPARLDFRYTVPGYLSNVAINLLGRHQATNAAVALATIEELRRQGWIIPEAAIRRGLADVVWPARVEVVSRRPTVVLDAAHNVASIAALVEVLDESFSAARRLLIFATTQEKDHRGMLQQLLGRFDRVIFTRYSNNPRSVPPEELLAMAKELAMGGENVSPRSLGEGPGVRVANLQTIATPSEAWSAIRNTATSDDLICITGSFFLASEMRALIAARPLTSV
jgi:dihydrofolate synthase / folylpolyglutamate synthase